MYVIQIITATFLMVLSLGTITILAGYILGAFLGDK